MQWMKQAACKGLKEDLNLFFPSSGQSIDCRVAKRICMGCPVREICLETFIGEHFGIWGGLSEKERRAERTRRRLAVSHA